MLNQRLHQITIILKYSNSVDKILKTLYVAHISIHGAGSDIIHNNRKKAFINIYTRRNYET
jgi:hypothetical protein